MGWNWEVLQFGFRAHTIFFGGVGWGGIGRYYILDLEPILYFLVGWGGVELGGITFWI